MVSAEGSVADVFPKGGLALNLVLMAPALCQMAVLEGDLELTAKFGAVAGTCCGYCTLTG